MSNSNVSALSVVSSDVLIPADKVNETVWEEVNHALSAIPLSEIRKIADKTVKRHVKNLAQTTLFRADPQAATVAAFLRGAKAAGKEAAEKMLRSQGIEPVAPKSRK